MNTFLLGLFAILAAGIIIVSVKSLVYNKDEDNTTENFQGQTEIEENAANEVNEISNIQTDFTNLMPKNNIIQIDNSQNYAKEIEAPPEIFTTPRLSSFASYIRS